MHRQIDASLSDTRSTGATSDVVPSAKVLFTSAFVKRQGRVLMPGIPCFRFPETSPAILATQLPSYSNTLMVDTLLDSPETKYEGKSGLCCQSA